MCHYPKIYNAKLNYAFCLVIQLHLLREIPFKTSFQSLVRWYTFRNNKEEEFLERPVVASNTDTIFLVKKKNWKKLWNVCSEIITFVIYCWRLFTKSLTLFPLLVMNRLKKKLHFPLPWTLNCILRIKLKCLNVYNKKWLANEAESYKNIVRKWYSKVQHFRDHQNMLIERSYCVFFLHIILQ